MEVINTDSLRLRTSTLVETSLSLEGPFTLHINDDVTEYSFFLLYRHKYFTGTYTTCKIHKHYIRDPSGLFPNTREFIDDVILVISLYYFIDVILSI